VIGADLEIPAMTVMPPVEVPQESPAHVGNTTIEGVPPSRKRKRALLVVLGLTSLVVLAVLVYAARFDLNSWKSEIEAAVSKATNMHVTIEGTLERKRWFPLTVVVHGLQFQNREEPVVRLENVECSSLELVPLMRRRLRMGTCTVDGFAIAIVRGADGHFNFERTTPRPRPPPGAGSAPPALFVSRLIARGGAYTFGDRGKPARAEITGVSANLHGFAIGRPPEGIRRAFSFKGELAWDALHRDALTLTQLKSKVSAGGGHFLLDDLSLDAFGGRGTGTFAADTSERTPRFELSLEVPRCHVEHLLEGLRTEPVIGGEAALAMHVRAAGRNKDELTQTLSGDVSLSGRHLQTHDLDMDKLIHKFDKTRGFSLIDLAAFFIAGPLGPIATKGYDFGRVYKQLGTGEGTLDRLLTTWRIDDGIAEAKDCALATKKNRVAFAGKIDLVHGVYQDAAIAVLDERGCSRYTEKLSGPVGGGRDIGKSTMKAIAGPFIGLYQKIHHAFDQKCDVFYSGSVPQPAKHEDKADDPKDKAKAHPQ
jgi:AsmA protein